MNQNQPIPKNWPFKFYNSKQTPESIELEKTKHKPIPFDLSEIEEATF